jgi:hypothetical protein
MLRGGEFCQLGMPVIFLKTLFEKEGGALLAAADDLTIDTQI